MSDISVQVVPIPPLPVVEHFIFLFSDGFTVDGGDFQSNTEDGNKELIDDIVNLKLPQKFFEPHKEIRINYSRFDFTYDEYKNDAPKELAYLIDVYQDGFTINRGELLPFTDENNKKDFDLIKSGNTPEKYRKAGYKTNMTIFTHKLDHADFKNKYSKVSDDKKLQPQESQKFYSQSNKNFDEIVGSSSKPEGLGPKSSKSALSSKDINSDPLEAKPIQGSASLGKVGSFGMGLGIKSSFTASVKKDQLAVKSTAAFDEHDNDLLDLDSPEKIDTKSSSDNLDTPLAEGELHFDGIDEISVEGKVSAQDSYHPISDLF